jgi:hypothetical protein
MTDVIAAGVVPMAPPSLADHYPIEVVQHIAQEVSLALRDGVVIQDGDGRIVWSNATAARLLRVSGTELLGTTSIGAEWQPVRADGSSLPEIEHPAVVARRTGERVERVVIGVRAGDLSQRWLLVDSSPLDLADERLVITVFSDVTAEIDGRRDFDQTLHEMQDLLIQREFPDVAGVRFVGEYRSVGVGNLLGGDFYGVYPASTVRHDFFIGDVCGHGVASASLSALARSTLRSVGRILDSPSLRLRELHAVVEMERPDTFLTALVGSIEQTPSSTHLRASSGGHPLPILVRDGEARRVGRAGQLVGMLADAPRPDFEIELLSGDRLIFHTDGVIHGARPRPDEDQFLASVPTDGTLDEMVHRLLRVGLPSDAVHQDDAAILACEVL